MNNNSLKQINMLRNATGCSMNECKVAMEKCGDFFVAYEYLSLRGCSVYRAKINENGEKIPFSESDYMELAKERASK